MRSDVLFYIDYLDGNYDAYAAGTTYGAFATTQLVSDVVLYDSVVYKSLQASNTGNTPDSSPAYWEAVADGDVWVRFYPSSVDAFKSALESGERFKRLKWGKVSFNNDPDSYTVASKDRKSVV